MLVVPPMDLAALLLWRGRRWGVVIGAIAHIKGAFCMLALAQIPIWLAIGAVSAASAALLLRPLR